MNHKKGFVIRYHFLFVAFFLGLGIFYLFTLEYTFKGYIGEDTFYLQEARDKGYDILLYISKSAELSSSQAAYDVGAVGGTVSCDSYYGYSIWTSNQEGSQEGCTPTTTLSQELFFEQTQSVLESYVEAKNSKEQFNFIPPNNYPLLSLDNGFLSGKSESSMNIVMGKGTSLPPTKKDVTISISDQTITVPIIKKEESTQILTGSLEGALPYENAAIMRNGPEFVPKVKEISKRLGIDPAWLMRAMHFESRGFNPQAVNPKSKATGLIQFMPETAKSLGTTTEELYKMNGLQQLDYVEKYFQPYKGNMKSSTDLYLAIFYPFAIGKGDIFIIGSERSSAYVQLVAKQNSIFDLNKDKEITVGEIKQYKQSTGWA